MVRNPYYKDETSSPVIENKEKERKTYILVEGFDRISFEKKVNDALDLGYILYGNPYAIGHQHFQPMIYYSLNISDYFPAKLSQ